MYIEASSTSDHPHLDIKGLVCCTQAEDSSSKYTTETQALQHKATAAKQDAAVAKREAEVAKHEAAAAQQKAAVAELAAAASKAELKKVGYHSWLSCSVVSAAAN